MEEPTTTITFLISVKPTRKYSKEKQREFTKKYHLEHKNDIAYKEKRKECNKARYELKRNEILEQKKIYYLKKKSQTQDI
jgi:hypothetical protein